MGRNGTGVRPASETTIEITFTYRGQRCRERVKLKPTPSNLKRAERHRAAILDAIERGTFDYATTFPDSQRIAEFTDQPGRLVTLSDFLDRWLREQKELVKASTWKDYRVIVLNTLIPAFGGLRLPDLKRRHIKNWAARQTISNKRIANILSPLRIALQEAMEDELIESNPLYGWTYRKKEPPKTTDSDIDPFTIDEQTAILTALQGQSRNLVQFWLWTGLRTSELVALEWGDIDWQRGVVRISRAITQAAKEAESPKTASGLRDIKLLPPAIEALKAQKTHSLLHPSGRVFLDPRYQTPWEGDAAIRKTVWHPAIKRAGVRYRRPYQCRHTYASMMLSAGESPMWVASQMGHADWTMIARVYGKWIPDADPTAGMKATEIFNKAKTAE